MVSSFLFAGKIAYARAMMYVHGDLVPRPKLYGIYDDQIFIRNKDTVPTLSTDSTRWKQLIIQSNKYTSFIFMNDRRKRLGFEVDSLIKYVVLYPNDDTLTESNFLIHSTDSVHLALEGDLQGYSLHVLLKKWN